MTLSFPQVPLGALVELQIGGVWTDVTADVYRKDTITISRGRSDEGARVDAGSLHFTLRNLDGKYSPRNPLSPYYGLIGRNTPVRVSVLAGSPYLNLPAAGSRATTPDTAVLDIVGDIDLRLDLSMDDWESGATVELAGKWQTTSNQRSWKLAQLPNGTIQLQWSSDGTAAATLSMVSTAVPAVPDFGRLALRVTLDVDNGASGKTAVFYTAPTNAGPWTQLGNSVTAATVTTIFSSSALVEVGDLSAVVDTAPVGKVYAFEMRNGIAGTVVANPSFEAQTLGATNFTDGAGRTWSLAGTASLTNRRRRFSGEISSWPPKWGASGKIVRVPIEAAGILRRLGQGDAALKSVFRRALTTQAQAPAAYWPCEDSAGASVLSSALPGGLPMGISGTSALASDSVFAASDALPHLTGAIWTGNVPSYSAASGVSSCVFLLSVPAAGTTNGSVLARIYTTGTAARFDIVYSSAAFPDGELDVNGYDSLGTLLFTGTSGTGPINGTPTRVEFRLTTVGADIQWSVESLAVGAASSAGGGDLLVGRTPGLIRQVVINPNRTLTDTCVGHICVFDNFTDLFALMAQLNGYPGETAGRRIERLCAEEGIPFRHIGDLDDTAFVGTQGVASLKSLLNDLAAADLGILHESRDVLGLGYRTRVSLYDQDPALALDYAIKGQVAPPLEPIDDDQTVRNDITISRSGGSSALAIDETSPLSILPPPDGVGRYVASETVNVAYDIQLPDIAAWRLHMGTWDEARYPTVSVLLGQAPDLIDGATLLDAGDRLTIVHPPSWLPPDAINLMGQGYTERIGIYTWGIDYNCSPYGPWTVGILDDVELGRLDTDGSSLAVAATSTDSALQVVTTDGPLWTTDPAEYPYDLRLGGETVTATACTSAVVDAFTRSTSSTWGSADVGGAWTLVGTASDYSTSGTTGRHSLGSVNVARATVVGSNVADFDVVTSVSTSALATGASHVIFLVSRYTGGNDFMAARLEFTTAAAVNLTIRKRVAGVDTQLATVTTTLTHVASTLFRVRFQGAGTTFKAKAWLASATEPNDWGLTVTDSSITAAGQVGVRSSLNTSNTNTLPVVAAFDNFALVNPQAVTVTRSVNGVVKAQAIATDVALAHPLILAL